MFCAHTTLLELSFTAIVSSFPNPERLRQLKNRACQGRTNNKGEEVACVGGENGAGAAGTLTVLFITPQQSQLFKSRRHRYGVTKRVISALMLSIIMKEFTSVRRG